MAICKACGCKTDDIDFVTVDLGEEVKVCSFCEKQINSIKNAEELTDAQRRWLKAALEKDVADREQCITDFLQSKYSVDEPAEKSAPAAIPYKNTSKPTVQKVGGSAAQNSKEVEALAKRVTALENEIKQMKRKQLIKLVVELGVPVVLLIIILIVFFAGGLYDYFLELGNIVDMM
ncbi:MAG: hypothetical protein ACI4IF_06905 [Acutalibacteraceae bacterium]